MTYNNYFLVLLLGSVVGSFIGLCIVRLPRGESIVYPPSHCDACGRRLKPGELIPILGYILCLGRCRGCGAPVPIWYPLLEILTAGIFIGLVYRFGFNVTALKYAFLASLLIVISGIDLLTYLIPDSLVLVGLGGGLLFLPAGDVSWQSALLGAVLGGGLLLFIALVSRGGMGGGDVKLGVILGLFLGWQQLLVALFLAVFTGALVGVLLVLLRKKGRRDAMPFAPFLALGTFGAFFWGPELISWYLKTFVAH